MNRKFTSGSLTGSVMIVLAQFGVLGRREMSKVLYRFVDEKDDTERYGTNTTRQITKALHRLKERKFITEVDCDTSRKEIYYALSEEGWAYIDQYDLPYHPLIRAMSVRNNKDKKILMRHSDALYVGRSMRKFSLGSEKLSYGALATGLGTMTVFNNTTENVSQETIQEIDDVFMKDGVCYSTLEIRNEYENSNNSMLKKNTSRRIGMIFDDNRMITLYNLDKKVSVMYQQAEMKFDDAVYRDIYKNWHSLGMHIRKVAYIMTPSLIYLPSFFHGCVDGVQLNPKGRKYGSTTAKKAVFSVDNLRQYDSIFMLPMPPEFSDYREALDLYSEVDYKRDMRAFWDMHPDVEGNVIICRYPDLVQLRVAYNNRLKVILVGPNNELLIDALSRCMRNCLTEYYDIKTGDTVPFTRYNENGLPLIGDTNRVNHSAKTKMDTLYKADQHKI